MFKRKIALAVLIALASVTAQTIAAPTTTNTVEPLACRLVKKFCQTPYGQAEQKTNLKVVTVALYSSEAEDPWFDESELDIKFKKRPGEDEDQA